MEWSRSPHLRLLIPDPRPVADVLLLLGSAATAHGLLAWAGAPTDRMWALRISLLTVTLQAGMLLASRVYRTAWRFVGFCDVGRVARALGFASGAAIMIHVAIGIPRPSPVFHFLDLGFSILALFAARFLRRRSHERIIEVSIRKTGRRTLIYGTGSDARSLIQRLQTDPGLNHYPVGLIDDGESRQDKMVGGLPVLGDSRSLTTLIRDYSIQDFIITTQDLPGHKLQTLLQAAHAARIRPRMLTDIGLDSQEAQKFELFRDVDLQDLLNRPEIRVDLKSTFDRLSGKVVLVTGAGGSIGSELARQIARQTPSRLLLVDHSEYNLYEIDREIQSSHPGLGIPILLNVKNGALVRSLFERERPDYVFHAAAYKHVHLVEANPYQSILNNVLSTRNLAESALATRCQGLVLISSDKAVNPVGLMGATKRICELIVTDHAMRNGAPFFAVRFGNVLGSSGSFIALLKRQIRSGGPITITHEEMTRYFMLIHEAVALVLKVASISKPGDINVLKMGAPVRILDIARKLITLLGKTQEEIPIVITGMRPGEKLFEELYLCGDELQTTHPDILVLPKGDSGYKAEEFGNLSLESQIDRIIQLARSSDPESVTLLKALVAKHSRTDTKAEAKPATKPEKEKEAA